MNEINNTTYSKYKAVAKIIIHRTKKELLALAADNGAPEENLVLLETILNSSIGDQFMALIIDTNVDATGYHIDDPRFKLLMQAIKDEAHK